MKTLKILLAIIVLIAAGIIIKDEIVWQFGDVGSLEPTSDSVASEELYEDPSCTVAGVVVHGDLYTYYDWESQDADDVTSAEGIVYSLERAQSLPNIKAIVLDIDSYGGYPVAAEEIADTLKDVVTKPTIAVIRGAGTSAAYWVASASDIIFASTLSDVGSIGVTQSYVGQSSSVQSDGKTYYQLSTGKFKDAGDPDKPLTTEERTLFERDLQIMHNTFVKAVAENRKLALEDVATLADGSSMLGEMALEKGLIDRIGTLRDAEDYLRTEVGVEPVVCW